MVVDPISSFAPLSLAVRPFSLKLIELAIKPSSHRVNKLSTLLGLLGDEGVGESIDRGVLRGVKGGTGSNMYGREGVWVILAVWDGRWPVRMPTQVERRVSRV